MSFAKFFRAFLELSKISKQMSITKSSNWERQREGEERELDTMSSTKRDKAKRIFKKAERRRITAIIS